MEARSASLRPVPPSVAEDEATRLVAACARLLFANGQTSERTQRSLMQLAERLGFTLRVELRWGQVMLRVGRADGSERLDVLPAMPAGVEMHKVTQALDVMDAVEAGRLDPAAALAELAAVERLAPVALPRFALFAGAGAAALAVIFGASDPVSLALIFASGAAGAGLRRGLAHIFPSPLPQPLAAALLAGLVTVLAAWAMPAWALPRGAVFFIALCPCLILVPGPHLLNGALDLARLRLPLGMERLGYAGLVLLLITVGLIAGLSVGGQSLPLDAGGMPVPLLVDVAAAGIAVAAYGTFFSMPWRMLPVPMAIGMAAHAVHWSVLAMGGGAATSSFIACLFVGTLVTPISNRMRLPFAAFAFASVVSLIPGSFVFRMADALVAMAGAEAGAAPGLLTAAVVDGTTAVTIMVAMAFGLILPKMLIEFIAPSGNR